MIRVKQDLDALDLTNRPQRLLSPTSAHEDDEEENFSGEDDAHECIPKKTTYDSGFVDTSDENNSSIMVKQEQNHHHYHSTPLRPQQIHSHIRRPSTSSSTCSSPTRQEQSNDKECRNTRFLGNRAVAVLNQWFQLNREYPYPDDEKTEQLANEAGITQKQVKKWFANKRVRSQMCYKPLYRSRKPRTSAPVPERQTQTNYNYIINHNNIGTPAPTLPPTSPMLFNPMATSMMMFMMQQHFLTTMMTGGFPQAPLAPPLPPQTTTTSNTTSLSSTATTTTTNTPRKPTTDRITRFWL